MSGTKLQGNDQPISQVHKKSGGRARPGIVCAHDLDRDEVNCEIIFLLIEKRKILFMDGNLQSGSGLQPPASAFE